MRAALAEARKGLGQTSPNPAVGAVIVRGDRIIARGYHHAAGQPHAEIEALRALRRPELARGATIVVTLEPCSTHGRTPPCTEAIRAAGLARVIYGATDPNPKHVGRAAQLLRAAGIEVVEGLLAEECAALNPHFNHWVATGLPWVIAKWAMSLDGRLNRPPGEPQWLTSPTARRHAMRLRAEVDAILVGAGTVRADDPQLTVRGIRNVRQPLRVVLTRSGDLPIAAKLFTDEARERTLVIRGKSLRAALRELGRRGVTSVLIEGGGDILGQAVDARLVQEVCCYLAPLLAGGSVPAVGGRGIGELAKRLKFKTYRYERLGPDVCLRGPLDA